MRRINKKNVGILIGVLLILIVSIIVLVNALNKDENKINQQQELENLFITMVKEYYEEFYYNQVGNTQEEKENFLKKYEKSGIQINLDSLSRYNSSINSERIKEFVNTKTNEKCNLEKSISIIYPMEPYKKDSYELKIKLDCGFENEQN